MKRTSTSKSELLLKRKLQLVRSTIRSLTPEQLGRVNGGNSVVIVDAPASNYCCADKYTGTVDV